MLRSLLIILTLGVLLGATMFESKFTLHSPAFENSKAIPSRYATTGVTGGKNISLPLVWEHAPEGTKSYAVSIVDLHPIAGKWVHWLIINIPPTSDSLPEGMSGTIKIPAGARELLNSYGKPGYGGPQPPKGSGPHNYEISIYALNVPSLPLEGHSSLTQFLKALEGKVLATAKTVGVFERM